jgi:triosephosphate isomerase
MINHAENKIPHEDIEFIVKRAKGLSAVTLVCAKNDDESRSISEFHPTIIAVEPPELIGTGVSVGRAKPGIITSSVGVVKGIDKDIIVLCGAGISGMEDVKRAIELGAEGILVSSFVTKAENQEDAIRQLLLGL